MSVHVTYHVTHQDEYQNSDCKKIALKGSLDVFVHFLRMNFTAEMSSYQDT